jgi:hypothetical protein
MIGHAASCARRVRGPARGRRFLVAAAVIALRTSNTRGEEQVPVVEPVLEEAVRS